MDLVFILFKNNDTILKSLNAAENNVGEEESRILMFLNKKFCLKINAY